MATTKLWKFKSRLDRLIDYAINGEKTENKPYVSGINCMPDTAFYEMTNVKKQFFKNMGRQISSSCHNTLKYRQYTQPFCTKFCFIYRW